MLINYDDEVHFRIVGGSTPYWIAVVWRLLKMAETDFVEERMIITNSDNVDFFKNAQE